MAKKGETTTVEPKYSLKLSEVQNLVKNELKKRTLEEEMNVTVDLDTMYLWTLHSKYGWCYKRLKRFYLDVFREHLKMRKHYELNDLYQER